MRPIIDEPAAREPRNLSPDRGQYAKMEALESLLTLNRVNQRHLKAIMKKIETRMEELLECGISINRSCSPDFLNKFSLISEVRVEPISLIHQMRIRETSSNEIDFVRNVRQSKIQAKPTKASLVQAKNLGPNPRKIDFRSTQKEDATGLSVFRNWLEIYRKEPSERQAHVKRKGKLKKLTYAEEHLLIEKHHIYGEHWEKIGYYFNGFTFENLYQIFQHQLIQKKVAWSAYENMLVLVLVEYYGKGKWAAISKFLKGRTEFQVRQRFCNILNPDVRENHWTVQQTSQLLATSKQYEYRWSKIAKELKLYSNKTDNALRRKFRNIMIKRNPESIREEISTKPSLAQSIIKFQKKYFSRRKARTATGAPQNYIQQQQLNQFEEMEPDQVSASSDQHSQSGD